MLDRDRWLIKLFSLFLVAWFQYNAVLQGRRHELIGEGARGMSTLIVRACAPENVEFYTKMYLNNGQFRCIMVIFL